VQTYPSGQSSSNWQRLVQVWPTQSALWSLNTTQTGQVAPVTRVYSPKSTGKAVSPQSAPIQSAASRGLLAQSPVVASQSHLGAGSAAGRQSASVRQGAPSTLGWPSSERSRKRCSGAEGV